MSARHLWVFLLGVFLLAGLSCKVFEDKKYLEARDRANKAEVVATSAKAAAEKAQVESRLAVDELAAAKTDEEKRLAAVAVTSARENLESLTEASLASIEEFKEALDHLDKVKSEAIDSPATTVIGMFTSTPGLIGTAATGLLALVTGVTQLSRRNYKAALGEVTAGYEAVTDRLTPEQKREAKATMAKIMKGTGMGKVLDKVLEEKGLKGKSRFELVTPPADQDT